MNDIDGHGWTEVSLGDGCVKTKTVDPRKTPEQEFEYVDVSSISNETFRIEQTQKLVGADAPSRARRQIRSGDILFATIRPTLQRIAQVPDALDGQVCSTGYIVLRPKPELEARFLMYALFRTDFVAAMDKLQSGASYPAVTDKQVRAQKIPLPPPEVQQRIVAVLDEVFAGLARARAHAVANLQNAQDLFTAALRSSFSDNRENWPLRNIADVCTDFGRGKSRHRPRNDPRLYGGDTPFIQTGDLSQADHFLTDYSKTYSTEGVAQSRVWPKGTVCVAIVGATIGESAILDFDGCFPDSVIGMIPEVDKADPEFLEYLLQFVKAELKEAGKGSARDNINLGTFSDRKFPIPDLAEQMSSVTALRELSQKSRNLEVLFGQKLQDLDDLRQSLLQKAFAGELTSKRTNQTTNVAVSGEQSSCYVLAIAYSRHAGAGREKTFGHVKAQKMLHLAEAVCHLDLGRDPIKDAAGPNDIVQMNRAEALAKKNNHFEFRKRSSGGYTFVPLASFGRAVREAENEHKDQLKSLVSLVDLLVPMDTAQAEVLTTVFAAWNNLIIDGEAISDEAIVRAAREEWHQDKLKIDRPKFSAAIGQIKAAQIEPDGTAKYVREKQERLL